MTIPASLYFKRLCHNHKAFQVCRMTPDDAFHIGQLPSSYLIYRRGTRKPYFAFYIYINHPFHSLTAKSRKFFGATKKGNWDTIYGRDPARADVRKSSHVSRRATSKQATGKKKTRDLWRRSSSSFRGTVVCSITERANDSRSYTNAGTGPSPVRLQISMQLVTLAECKLFLSSFRV